MTYNVFSGTLNPAQSINQPLLSLFTSIDYWTIYNDEKISRICSGSLWKFNQLFSGP